MSEDAARYMGYNDPTHPPYAKGRKDWIVKVRCVYEEEMDVFQCTEEEARKEPFEWAKERDFPQTEPVHIEVLEQEELE